MKLMFHFLPPTGYVTGIYSLARNGKISERVFADIFLFCLQNHDNQKNITHLEEIIREQQVSPWSYTRTAPPGVGGEGGQGNYWVPVSSRGIQGGADPTHTHIFTRSTRGRAVRVRLQMRYHRN